MHIINFFCNSILAQSGYFHLWSSRVRLFSFNMLYFLFFKFPSSAFAWQSQKSTSKLFNDHGNLFEQHPECSCSVMILFSTKQKLQVTVIAWIVSANYGEQIGMLDAMEGEFAEQYLQKPCFSTLETPPKNVKLKKNVWKKTKKRMRSVTKCWRL